jgi:hypothetical protein
MRGRRLRDVEDIGHGQTRITAEDGATMITDSTVYIAIQDRAFRESLREAVDPVAREGIDYVDIGREGDRERITAGDLPAFDVPESGEVLRETTREAFLQLLSVSFQPGNKWRFTEGDAPYWASMTDSKFAQRVQRHEVEFGTGDILRATVNTKQTRSGTSLGVEHTVIEVHEIVKQGRQVELPFGDNDKK